MPKVVDHDARREEIVDALLRVAERDGLDGVSLRTVAREGGWSTGVLAHYFPAKDGLLALRMLTASVRRRAVDRALDDALAAALRTSSRPPPPPGRRCPSARPTPTSGGC